MAGATNPGCRARAPAASTHSKLSSAVSFKTLPCLLVRPPGAPRPAPLAAHLESDINLLALRLAKVLHQCRGRSRGVQVRTGAKHGIKHRQPGGGSLAVAAWRVSPRAIPLDAPGAATAASPSAPPLHCAQLPPAAPKRRRACCRGGGQCRYGCEESPWCPGGGLQGGEGVAERAQHAPGSAGVMAGRLASRDAACPRLGALPPMHPHPAPRRQTAVSDTWQDAVLRDVVSQETLGAAPRCRY